MNANTATTIVTINGQEVEVAVETTAPSNTTTVTINGQEVEVSY